MIWKWNSMVYRSIFFKQIVWNHICVILHLLCASLSIPHQWEMVQLTKWHKGLSYRSQFWPWLQLLRWLVALSSARFALIRHWVSRSARKRVREWCARVRIFNQTGSCTGGCQRAYKVNYCVSPRFPAVVQSGAIQFKWFISIIYDAGIRKNSW